MPVKEYFGVRTPAEVKMENLNNGKVYLSANGRSAIISLREWVMNTVNAKIN